MKNNKINTKVASAIISAIIAFSSTSVYANDEPTKKRSGGTCSPMGCEQKQ